MSPFSNAFEKKWFCIFMALYVFVMLPIPSNFNTVYDPVYLGIPDYIFGWLANSAVVIVAIVVWRIQCLARPEYKDEGEDQ